MLQCCNWFIWPRTKSQSCWYEWKTWIKGCILFLGPSYMNFLCQPLQDNSAVVGLARQKDVLVLLEQLSGQNRRVESRVANCLVGKKYIEHVSISWGGKLTNPCKQNSWDWSNKWVSMPSVNFGWLHSIFLLERNCLKLAYARANLTERDTPAFGASKYPARSSKFLTNVNHAQL